MGPTKRVRGQIGVRPGHAEGRSHPFPAMTGLTGEVGDLMHGQGGLDENLLPLERIRGERDEAEVK